MMRTVGRFEGNLFGASLITIAANLGGIFFPFSNPQNLIVFHQKGIPSGTFVGYMLPLVIIGLILLWHCQWLVAKELTTTPTENRGINKWYLCGSMITFIVMVMAIIVPVPLGVSVGIVMLITFVIYRQSFLHYMSIIIYYSPLFSSLLS